ncbi:MAG: DegV family protein [Anaerolineales bacterium]
MRIGLVTDSTSDLPHDLLEQHAIAVIPAVLVLEGQTYADGKGISRADFYTRLPTMSSPPTTAAPSVGEFAALYARMLDEGHEHIISIHAAGELTTIVNSARLAAQDFPARVTVLDSGSLSLGLGFQVLAAAEAAAQGATLPQALAAIQSARERTVVRASLDTMEYLKRSGRVPAAVAALGGLLNIKPLVGLTDGVVKPLGAARTTMQGNQRILDMLLACGPLEKLTILHTNAEDRTKWLLNALMQTAPQNAPREIRTLMVTTVIGTHVGPRGLGFAALKRPPVIK